MKKILSIVFVLILTISLVSCGSDKNKSNITTDNSKDSVSVEKQEKTNTDNIKEFKKGSEFEINGLQIKIKNIKFTTDVLPDKTNGAYTHYPADEGKVFLEVDTDIKNTNKQEVLVENIGTIGLDYNNGYKYDGWLIPEDSQLGFSYANIKYIKPLETLGVRWVVDLPKEVKDINKPTKITLSIGNEIYVCNFR